MDNSAAAIPLFTLGGIATVIGSYYLLKHCKSSNKTKSDDDGDVENNISLNSTSAGGTISEIRTLGFDQVHEKALNIFPALMETESKDHFKKSIRKIKTFLRVALEKKTQPWYGGDASLLHRINAPKLLESMGMRKNRVESIFWSVMAIESELEVVGRASFYDALLLLIENIEYKNPLGELHDQIEELQGRGENYSHLCVRVDRGFLKQTLVKVAGTLHQADIVDPFMHGTSAANAESVIAQKSRLNISNGMHDFGTGFYCFRDNMGAALSFAISKAIVYEGNPCVLVFLNHKKNVEGSLMNVNTKKIKDKTLKKVLENGNGKFDSFVEARNSWNGGDWQNDTLLYWKTFVHLSRTYTGFWNSYANTCRPGNLGGTMGYLHDAADHNIDNTNDGGEPIVDPERWMQYCFYEPEALGYKILFVEFQFDFAQWEGNANAVDQDLMTAWRQYIKG